MEVLELLRSRSTGRRTGGCLMGSENVRRSYVCNRRLSSFVFILRVMGALEGSEQRNTI